MGREIRRVPLDFDWPVGKKWEGFVNPYWRHRTACPACGGSGYAPEAKRFSDEWYGHAPFDPAAYGATPLTIDHPAIRAIAERNVDRSPDFYRGFHVVCSREGAIEHDVRRLFEHFKGQWCHHLIQADVDALVAGNRLWDFRRRWDGEKWADMDPPPRVAADDVNAWSLSGMGHDAVNQWVCVKARCEREGVPTTCPACDGDGDAWPSKAHKALHGAWKDIPPPEGDGWQCWETTSEGSPISPVFATADELVAWLVREEGCSEEAARRFVETKWAPSMVMVRDADGTRIASNVEALVI